MRCGVTVAWLLLALPLGCGSRAPGLGAAFDGGIEFDVGVDRPEVPRAVTVDAAGDSPLDAPPLRSPDAGRGVDAPQARTPDAPRGVDAPPMAPDTSADRASDSVNPGSCSTSALGGSRPTTLRVPAGYSSAKAYPLIIELHGRGGSGGQIEPYFRMRALADANQVFVIAPNGTHDTPPAGTDPSSFWNATDGCCNIWGSQVDDVAYLRSLICWTQAHYTIDPKRVYIIGASNGGFMAHRMACEASDVVAAIISVAGAVYNDPNRCKPTHPVGMLEIHGTADEVVPYNGTAAFAKGPVPSAPTTYESWATRNGCSGPNSDPVMFDFDSLVSGKETVAVNKSGVSGCRARTELWAVAGGTHIPVFSAAYSQFFIDWFLANPRR